MSKIFKTNEIEDILGVRKYLLNRNNPMFNFIFNGGLSDEWVKRNLPTLKEKIPEIIKMNEYPIGVTRLGEIICIPRLDETGSFFYTGQPGFGKTFSLHRMLDGAYNHWDYNIVGLNDWQPETPAWSVMQSNKKFMNKIALTTMENPRPLPVVHLVPKLENIPIPNFTQDTKIYYKINFQEFIKNIDIFVSKEEMGGSEKYFKAIDFSRCRKWEDVETTIESYFQDNAKRGKDVGFKIKNMLLQRIREGVTNFDRLIISKVAVRVVGTAVTSGTRGKELNRGNLLTMLIECRLIPILITSGLYSTRFYPQYLKYCIKEIIDYQKSKPDSQKKNMFVYIEEFNRLLDKRGSDDLIEAIKLLVTNGRFMRIGSVISAQNINKPIYNDIISNTDYGFVFHLKSAPDLSFVKTNFHLDEVEIERIRHLDKLEFLGVCGEKRKFIIYDILGDKKYETRKVWGVTIPPLSHHSPAENSNKIESFFDLSDNLKKSAYCRQLLHENKLRLVNLEHFDHTIDSSDNDILRYLAEKNIITTNLLSPKLFQGINLRKVYFKNEEKIRPISYNELQDFGYMIYYNDREYFIAKKGNYEGSSRPEVKQPSSVNIILMNEENKTARLWGKTCSEEWTEL